MAQELDRIELAAGDGIRSLRWLETSTRSDPELSPAAQATIARCTCADVRAESVVGPSFWQTAEIEVVPELLRATVGAVLQ